MSMVFGLRSAQLLVLVEWADLEIIDLSKACTEKGRAELAPRVRDVMRKVGFMYVVNHGLTKDQVCFYSVSLIPIALILITD